ncbi:uncharacterized protein TRAVEDRAFT_45851 [Trametes versicolor FP-101664 SS1]|uniref:uncharacterized protein n=1 Tax=Trametes versicolor (strain FP-101664) TaxID=717944 RepID=UPI00046231DE|nr:uncharacterized protein TRAVEDRAFT_45851 [Trametes versicolor FP-101664 SS1]EIW60603.1 hypothetical protein TRAVEDRAFT_45851 [Trametes versicolor FP-101664 SS1]
MALLRKQIEENIPQILHNEDWRTPSAAPRLPHEILLVIFRAARAPRYLRAPSVNACHGSNSTWLSELRVRKALMLVCKGWSDVATELFYEDIVLRRMGQIIALADILTTNHGSQRDLAMLVKSIRLDTCIVLGPCADAVRDAFTSILSLCIALRAFEYHTAKSFPTTLTLPPGDSAGAFNPSWFVEDGPEAFQLAFRERVSMLTSLDLAMRLSHKQVAHLHRLLSTATCLEILKVGQVYHVEHEGDHLDSLPVLHLPKLKALYLPVIEPRFVAYVSTNWVIPCLKQLTTLFSSETFKPRTLLAAHGARLVYLHLYPKRDLDLAICNEDLARVVELCPVVEHLVLGLPIAMFKHRSKLSAFCALSAALRYLDIWTWGHAFHSPRRYKFPTAVAVHVRYLNRRLPFVDLPTICDPRIHLEGDETRIVDFPWTQAAWSKYCVFPVITPHSVAKAISDEDANADEWSEYNPEREETDSDNTDDTDQSTREDASALLLEERGYVDGSEEEEDEADENDQDKLDEDVDDSEGVSERESDYRDAGQ